jgi:type IV pilus assembly protein PilE
MCQVIESRRRQRGFTLVELMITVAIVGILAAIAIPSYREHVRRGAVEEGLAQLAQGRVAMQQHFLDNPQTGYEGAPCPVGSTRFPITCVDDADEFTLTATGNGPVAGFVFDIDETDLRRTTASPWGTGNCWIARKGDSC